MTEANLGVLAAVVSTIMAFLSFLSFWFNQQLSRPALHLTFKKRVVKEELSFALFFHNNGRAEFEVTEQRLALLDTQGLKGWHMDTKPFLLRVPGGSDAQYRAEVPEVNVSELREEKYSQVRYILISKVIYSWKEAFLTKRDTFQSVIGLDSNLTFFYLNEHHYKDAQPLIDELPKEYMPEL